MGGCKKTPKPKPVKAWAFESYLFSLGTCCPEKFGPIFISDVIRLKSKKQLKTFPQE